MKEWLTAALSNAGEPSTKRIAFAAVIGASIGWLTAWLIVALATTAHAVPSEWVASFGILIGAVGGAYVSGAALSERNRTTPPTDEKPDAPQS